MRILSSRLTTFLRRRRPPGHVQSRNFSSHNAEDDHPPLIVQILGVSVIGGLAAYLHCAVPFIDDWNMQQAMTLLKSESFKTDGASALARYATDDKRRMKIVEIGGAQELVNMLRDAEGYYKKLEALKALAALSGSDEAVAVLHRAGAISVIKSTPVPLIGYDYLADKEDPKLKRYKSSLLKRFQDPGYDIPFSHSDCEKAISKFGRDMCLTLTYDIPSSDCEKAISKFTRDMCFTRAN